MSKVVAKIERGLFTFSGSGWTSISKDAKNFVRALLKVKDTERPTAERAMKLPWIKNYLDSENVPGVTKDGVIRRPASTLDHDFESERESDGNAVSPGPRDSVRSDFSSKSTISEAEEGGVHTIKTALWNYGGYSGLKKAALMVVAHQLTAHELTYLRQAFQAFDTGNNGTISLVELKEALKQSENNLSDDDVEKVFHAIDLDNTGRIKYTEFLAATVEIMGNLEMEKLEEAFDRIDSDDTGFISFENLKDLLGSQYNEQQVHEMLDKADFKKTGHLDFEEFRQMMLGGATWEIAHLQRLQSEIAPADAAV